jgi:hypothetical protein
MKMETEKGVEDSPSESIAAEPIDSVGFSLWELKNHF